jgi:tRNA acetyltransferase TAN1
MMILNVFLFNLKNDPKELADETSKNDNDFEKALKEELNELKKEDNEVKIFDAGAKYTIFIKISQANVNKTVEAIFEDIKINKKSHGRYVQRLLPVVNTCKAFMEDIENCLNVTLDMYYEIPENNEEGLKYSYQIRSSNNGSISRDNVIKLIITYFKTKSQLNRIDHDNPDVLIIVNTIRNICFLSYVKNFFEYRKYNLVEMSVKHCVKEEKNDHIEEKDKIKNDI